MGEVGKGVESEGISGIWQAVVVGNEGIVILKDGEPVQLFLGRKVVFVVVLRPRVEENGGGCGGERFGGVEEERDEQQWA